MSKFLASFSLLWIALAVAQTTDLYGVTHFFPGASVACITFQVVFGVLTAVGAVKLR